MKAFCLLLALCLLLGCGAVNSPIPPLAPNYASKVDQQLGQDLAAAHDLAKQATIDYGKLTPTQQAAEANQLHAFVAAVNAADSLYNAYHALQATAAQVQAGLAQVSSTQAAYASVATNGGH